MKIPMKTPMKIPIIIIEDNMAFRRYGDTRLIVFPCYKNGEQQYLAAYLKQDPTGDGREANTETLKLKSHTLVNGMQEASLLQYKDHRFHDRFFMIYENGIFVGSQ